MVLIRHPNNDILPRRTDATSPKNPLNTLFSKYRIKPITKMITNHSGTPSTIIFHLFSNIDSIRLNPDFDNDSPNSLTRVSDPFN